MLSSEFLLQELCNVGLSWDDCDNPISESHCAFWKLRVDSLPQIERLQVKRCFKPSVFERPVGVQLHHHSMDDNWHTEFAHTSSRQWKWLYSMLLPYWKIETGSIENRINAKTWTYSCCLSSKTGFNTQKRTKIRNHRDILMRFDSRYSKRFPSFVANWIATIKKLFHQILLGNTYSHRSISQTLLHEDWSKKIRWMTKFGCKHLTISGIGKTALVRTPRNAIIKRRITKAMLAWSCKIWIKIC